MLFFMLILLLIVLNGLQFSTAGCFNEHYLDKKDTTAVNGIFVVLIVFSHYAQYADLTGIYDEPYMIVRASQPDGCGIIPFLFRIWDDGSHKT